MVAIAAAWYGFRLRHDLYVNTADIHFTKDVDTAWLSGRNAGAVGLFNIYERLREGFRFSEQVDLDYTPPTMQSGCS